MILASFGALLLLEVEFNHFFEKPKIKTHVYLECAGQPQKHPHTNVLDSKGGRLVIHEGYCFGA